MNQYPYYPPPMYYPPPRAGTNWAAVIAGLAALGVGAYVIYWMWENGYFGCTRDGQCPIGYRCSKGRCVQSTGCTTNNDCPPGYVCQGGYCIKTGGPECRIDADCGEGYRCVGGFCIPKAPTLLDISSTAMSTIEGVNRGPLRDCYVEFTNIDTHEKWSAVSNDQGYWRINNIKLGVYKTHAEALHHADSDYDYIPLTEAYGYRGGPGPNPDGTWPVPGVTIMVYLPYFDLHWDRGTGDPIFEKIFDLSPHYVMNHIEGTITVSRCDLQHTRFARICLIDIYGHEEQIWEAGWGGVGGGSQVLQVNKNFTERRVDKVRIYGSCITLFWEFPPLEAIDLTIEAKVL